MDCAACCGNIANKEEYLRCTVLGCSKNYHVLCTGEKSAHSIIKTWICPECRCAAKKGGDNSLTPVGLSKKRQDANVTIRQKGSRVRAEDEAIYDTPDQSKSLSDVHQLRTEMVQVREQLTNSNTLIASYERKLNRSITLIAEYDHKLTQSVSTIASYEAKIEAFTSLMEKLLDGQKKCDCGCKLAHNDDGSRNQLQTVTPQTKPVSVTSSPSHASPGAPQQQWKPTVAVRTPTTKQVKAKGAQVHKQENKKTDTYASSLVKPLSAQPYPGSSSQYISESIPAATSKTDDWVEVKKKKSWRPTSLCGAAGPTVTSLKAVEVRKYLHLWNMASGVAEVREYLRLLCPNGTCTVEELTAKGDYKSYKLGVPAAYFDTCFSIEVWPINARIKIWMNHRITKQSSTSAKVGTSTSPRPFHERPSERASPTQ